MYPKRFKPLRMLLAATLVVSTMWGAGEVHDGKVSAYLRGALQDLSAVTAALKSGGFEPLGNDVIDAKGELTSVAFTCPTLKKLANRPSRGFAASLRVLIDKKNHQITITNPLYFEKAFLQKEFDEASALKVLKKINAAFSGLKDSKDALAYKDLGHYHFMFAMPYYEDMERVAKGAHDALLAKLKAYDGGKHVVFTLPLSKGRTLVGFKLDPKTAGFVQKIGVQNAALLPYPILIENGEARILAPKFYIALSYPLLKMSQFMKIASTPGAIADACKAAFK